MNIWHATETSSRCGQGRQGRNPPELPTIVGRTHDAGLMIAHKTVSRRHCELFERHGMLFVRDTGSRNGTLVDSRPIKKEAMVKPGHTLTIGPLTFRADYEPADSFIDSDDPVQQPNGAATAPHGRGLGDDCDGQSGQRNLPGISESEEEGAPRRLRKLRSFRKLRGELEFEELTPTITVTSVCRRSLTSG